MDYLAELSAFDQWLETNDLSSSAIALWFALMQTANRANWKTPLTVAISTLERRSGLERRAVYRARNALKQAGLIDFRDRGSNRCSEYRINSVLYLFDTQSVTHTVTQSDTHGVTHTVTHSDTISSNKNIRNTPSVCKENQRQRPFQPPSLQDVEDYCRERNNNVDARRFWDYYNAADWTDQGGRRVRNWKQKMIAVWEKQQNEPAARKGEHNAPVERDYTTAPDGMRLLL